MIIGEFKKVVARTGFEPVIFALRGRCPEPLDERAKLKNKYIKKRRTCKFYSDL